MMEKVRTEKQRKAKAAAFGAQKLAKRLFNANASGDGGGQSTSPRPDDASVGTKSAPAEAHQPVQREVQMKRFTSMFQSAMQKLLTEVPILRSNPYAVTCLGLSP